MSILSYQTKQTLTKTISDLVSSVPPAQLPSAWNAASYGDAMMDKLSSLSRVFAGERHAFVGKESGDSPGPSFPDYVKAGDRVDLKYLDRNDFKWIRKTVVKAATQRWYPEYAVVGTGRLATEEGHQWLDWGASDCVFSAILVACGLRFVGSGGAVEEAEKSVEIALAGELGLPTRLVQDELLVWTVEGRLGWKRRSDVRDVGDLKAAAESAASGKMLLASCCQNATTDFWHTILVQCRGSKRYDIVDRQAERKGWSSSLPGDPSNEADAWEIDGNSELLRSLATQIDVPRLRVTYASMLA